MRDLKKMSSVASNTTSTPVSEPQTSVSAPAAKGHSFAQTSVLAQAPVQAAKIGNHRLPPSGMLDVGYANEDLTPEGKPKISYNSGDWKSAKPSGYGKFRDMSGDEDKTSGYGNSSMKSPYNVPIPADESKAKGYNVQIPAYDTIDANGGYDTIDPSYDTIAPRKRSNTI